MVEREARLHEATVKTADDHVGQFVPRKRRASSGRSTRTVVVTVDPEVMSTAKALVRQRPGTRLRVVDATTVVVENLPTT